MLIFLLSALLFVKNVLKKFSISYLREHFCSLKSIMNNFSTQASSIASNSIVFKAGDKQNCFEITDKDVTVFGSSGKHDHGSSKVKLKSIVDYKWEAKNYRGHLITVHLDGKHIAYVIKVSNKASGTEGMIRVANSHTGRRALIKGMKGDILDIQFAHIEKEYILACIEESVLHVHKIELPNEETIDCNLLLRIEDPIQKYIPKYDKISWCPYVPEDGSEDYDDDVSQLIVWARGNKFQCFNISMILQADGAGTHSPDNLTEGYLHYSDTTTLITWIVLSPDGSTLGVGSEDGFIRFYQIYFHEKEPRCLHHWNPHNGKPISSFFFLEDLTKSQEAYWKNAITATDNNTEIKVWECESWECLQRLTFAARDTIPRDTNSNTLLAELDRTSSYLVLSNLENRTVYVLQIINNPCEKTKPSSNSDNQPTTTIGQTHSKDKSSTTTKKNFVFLKSISEFPLSSAILSFGIVDAAVRKYKCALNDNYAMDEFDDYDEENNAVYCVVIKMFIVQPKSVQECHILYQPMLPISAEVKSSISDESINSSIKDELTDFSGSSSNVSQGKGNSTVPDIGFVASSKNNSAENCLFTSPSQSTINLIEPAKNLNISPKATSTNKVNNTTFQKNFNQINLMTPDSFSPSTTVGKKSPDGVSSEVMSTILMLASVTGTNNKIGEKSFLNLMNNKTIEDEEQRKFVESQKEFSSDDMKLSMQDNIASGKSSPSREVEEILSFQDVSKFIENTHEENVNALSSLQANLKKSLESKSPFEDAEQIKKSNGTEWPKVPDIRNITKHSATVPNKTSTQQPSPPTIATLEQINSKLDTMMDVINQQSANITDLKLRMNELKKTIPNNSQHMKDVAYKIEVKLSKLLEEYLIRYEKEHNRKLESFVAARDIKYKEMQEGILHMLNQFIFTTLLEKISGILVIELQRNIVPIVITKLDQMNQQIQIDVTQKLSVTDQLLRENISQVCKSKSIIDAFGNSVLLGVQNGLQATYVESMSNILIPAYEKSSKEMFSQLHDVFTSGIREILEQFEGYFLQLSPINDGTDEILENLGELQKQLDLSFLQEQVVTKDILLDIRKEIKSWEANLMKTVTDTINSEIKKSFEIHTANLEDSVLSVVRSQSQTPAPVHYDVQDQIRFLLSQGQINKAFHQALLANDLSLVEFTLEKADFKSVFNPCVLEQTVLLSLIQQISADMSNHSDIRQLYLSEVILNLNLNDPVTKEHAPKVMRELYRKCQMFLSTNSSSPMCSNLKMLMMAVQGMGYKIF